MVFLLLLVSSSCRGSARRRLVVGRVHRDGLRGGGAGRDHQAHRVRIEHGQLRMWILGRGEGEKVRGDDLVPGRLEAVRPPSALRRGGVGDRVRQVQGVARVQAKEPGHLPGALQVHLVRVASSSLLLLATQPRPRFLLLLPAGTWSTATACGAGPSAPSSTSPPPSCG